MFNAVSSIKIEFFLVQFVIFVKNPQYIIFSITKLLMLDRSFKNELPNTLSQSELMDTFELNPYSVTYESVKTL